MLDNVQHVDSAHCANTPVMKRSHNSSVKHHDSDPYRLTG